MKIDMNPEAITMRIRQVFQLRRLCMALGKSTSIREPDLTKVHHPKSDSAASEQS